MALAAFALTACDNFELPKPQAPTNLPEAPFTVGDVQFAPEVTPIMLTADTPDDELIKVGSYIVENWPAAYTFGVAAQASDDANFETNVIDMNIAAADGELTATAEHLTWAVKQLYGSKGEVSRTLYIRYQLLALNNGHTEYIVGDPNKYYNVAPITVTLPKVAYEYEVIWTPGPANNWSPTASMGLYPDEDYTTWSGYAVINDMFKFSVDDAWSVNWGGADGILKEGGDNIEVAQNGLYFVELNLAEQTYTLTYIANVSVIGDAALGWTDDAQLAPVGDNYAIWSGNVTFNETGAWKFRMNNDWVINLGGEMTNLVANGSDIPTPGAGTYTVTIDFSKHPYTCTVVGN